mmetsp:Transcript_26510/g.40070  ORF Transcript_26510/g.40070 Transcript_26510/m.40070 type:complete len:220 (-) Transcript_26510:1480-2139(-)
MLKGITIKIRIRVIAAKITSPSLIVQLQRVQGSIWPKLIASLSDIIKVDTNRSISSSRITHNHCARIVGSIPKCMIIHNCSFEVRLISFTIEELHSRLIQTKPSVAAVDEIDGIFIIINQRTAALINVDWTIILLEQSFAPSYRDNTPCIVEFLTINCATVIFQSDFTVLANELYPFNIIVTFTFSILRTLSIQIAICIIIALITGYIDCKCSKEDAAV